MADETPQVQAQEAGWQFRAEMAVMNVVYGYWRHAVGLAAIVLVGALIYGQVHSYQVNRQRNATAEVAQTIDTLRTDLAAGLDPDLQQLLADNNYDLAGVLNDFSRMEPQEQTRLMISSRRAAQVILTWQQLEPEVQQAMVSSSDPLATVLMFVGDLDDAAKAKLSKAAGALVVEGASSSGAASTEAYLEAADIYRKLGDAEHRRLALEAAAKGITSGPLYYATQINLAEMDVDAGNNDGAIAKLQALVAGSTGFLAQDADLELGLVYEYAGKKDEAEKLYAEFLTKWPDSPRLDEVKARQDKLARDKAAPSKEG